MILQDPPAPLVQAAVIARAEERCRAMVERDFAALERILSPSLIYIHAAGFVEDRSRHLEVLRSGRVRYLAMRNTVQRVLGGDDWAILHGRLSADVMVEGRPAHVQVIFTTHWVLADADWSLVAWAAVNEQADPAS